MISWFARHRVAANLLMGILIVGGLLVTMGVEKELFPEFSLDRVRVSVVYPGATPSEVEESIVVRIEEAVQGVDGIKKIQSTASESVGVVIIEARRGYKISRLKEDVKSRVDSITTFPEDAERPLVDELLLPRRVLYVGISGDTDERTLKRLGEKVRDDLLNLPGISQVQLIASRDFEISIEVSENRLRELGLTFEDVMNAVRRSSLDVPGGTIRAEGGDILLRTVSQAYRGADFEAIPVLTRSDGTRILLGEIATIIDGFVDEPQISLFNGKRATIVEVQETGDESPLDISEKVNRYLEELRPELPAGIETATFADASFYLRDRLMLLIHNGLVGLALVYLTLSLFLRPALAFYVALGIPVSFLGCFMIAPMIGLTINLVSLFAFILVLGIVVDDAIVVGESIFTEFQRNGPGVESAIRGTHEVSTPVTFAVLTTMVAFVPVFFIPGIFGKFLFPISVVVITTLFWSLVESKLILPRHLSSLRTGTGDRANLGWLLRTQRRIADGLEHFIENRYHPLLEWVLHYRYFIAALFFCLIILAVGIFRGGIVRVVMFPPVPSDFILVQVEYPEGSPIEMLEDAIGRLQRALEGVTAEAENKGLGHPVKYEAIFTGNITESPITGGGGSPDAVTYLVELTKSEERALSAPVIAARWREVLGDLPGVRKLAFVSRAAASPDNPLEVELTGADWSAVRAAAEQIKQRLREIEGVFDISDDAASGKRELKLALNPMAEPLGVKAADLGRQVRQAFYGGEAQRVQRGRDDLRVMVRYPREERLSLGNLENMRIRTATGEAIPLSEVAEVDLGEGFAAIRREDRRRVLSVVADLDKEHADVRAIVDTVQSRIIPEVLAGFPGVTASLGGEEEENRQVLGGLAKGAFFAAFVIYALLAIAFSSYTQPLIVMSVIPFGLVGALLGHLFTGQSLSILSFLGIIALSGVVVNDSLVLIDYINRHRDDGAGRISAARAACAARFRPIILTSLTTFAGLIPILLERSLQAQFLIPMATSLGFGVLFATAITLFLVPCIYLILDDIRPRKR